MFSVLKYYPNVRETICKMHLITYRNFTIASKSILKIKPQNKNQWLMPPARYSGHDLTRIMAARNSRYNWRSFWDDIHFYLLLGLIPYFCIASYANIVIGKAELREIPENYEPRHWEYYQHPISRFFVRNIFHHYQKHYERCLAVYVEANEDFALQRLTTIYNKMEPLNEDYKTAYFIPVNPIGVNVARDIFNLEKEKGIRTAR